MDDTHRAPADFSAALFESTARRDLLAHSGDEPALITREETLSFTELTEAILRCADDLRRTHPAGARLAVVVDDTVAAVVTMIAVPVAGCVVVPLDPALPHDRRTVIIDLAQATLIDPIDVAARNRTPGAEDAHDVEAASAVDRAAVDPDALAAIIYTSGSTGAPKGVLQPHRILVGHIHDLLAMAELGRTDRVANLLPMSFAPGFVTTMTAVARGIPLHVLDPRHTGIAVVAQWLRSHRVTTLHAAVATVRSLTAEFAESSPSPALDSIRVTVASGEAMDGADARAWQRGPAPRSTVIAPYGSTEHGMMSFRRFAPGDEIPDGLLPAGFPAAGRFAILDGESEAPTALPIGELGHVAIATPRLAGYADAADGSAADLTAGWLARHVRLDGTDFHRTGDLGRLDSDGALKVTGRADEAIKIRGYLVEPAEVRTAIRGVPGVTEAEVVAVTGTDTDTTDGSTGELAAYYAGDSNISPAHIRAHLRKALPGWMIPRHIVFVPELPRTERGKIDRAALPDVAAQGPKFTEDRAATTDQTQLGLLRWLAPVVGTSSVPLDADFAELGVDSLGMARILTIVKDYFHVELTVAELMSAPTIRRLGERIDRATVAGVRERAATDPVLVPLRVVDTSAASVFLVAGGGSPAIAFAPLVSHLPADVSIYGLQQHGLENRARPDATIIAAATRNVTRVRQVAPHGPYRLVGHSMGGLVALEMAAQLAAAGEEVERVVVLDAQLPPAAFARIPGLPAGITGEPMTPMRLDAEAAIPRPGALGDVRSLGQYLLLGFVRWRPTTQWYLLFQHSVLMLKRHRPTPYPGPVTLMRTADNGQTEHTWARLATGDLEILDVDGGHIGILHEPKVAAIGELIGGRLGLG